MTGDLAWLKELGVPVDNLAARIGRTETCVITELQQWEPPGAEAQED